MKINKRNRISIFLTKVSCILLKKPFFTFILNDSPENIYSRNKEYKISDIKYYQKSILDLCNSLSIEYELIDINNKDQLEISNYIFNKINKKLKKKEIGFYEDLENYYEEYKPKEMKTKEISKTRKKYIEGGIFILLMLTILYFYKK